MPRYEARVTINGNREAVWKILSNVVAWPEWLPTVTSVEPLDGAALQIGRKYLISQPNLRARHWNLHEDRAGS